MYQPAVRRRINKVTAVSASSPQPLHRHKRVGFCLNIPAKRTQGESKGEPEFASELVWPREIHKRFRAETRSVS